MIMGIKGQISEAFDLRLTIVIATKKREITNNNLFVLNKTKGANSAVIASGQVQNVPRPSLGIRAFGIQETAIIRKINIENSNFDDFSIIGNLLNDLILFVGERFIEGDKTLEP